MKQIKTNIISIIILGVVLLFAGCNNNPVLPEQSNQNGIEITGTVSLDLNAFPSQLQNNSSARAAFYNSNNASIVLDETTFTVIAFNEFNKYKIPGEFIKLDAGYTYKVTLPIPGRWEISITGKSQEGNIEFAGHAFVTVTISDSDGSLRLSDYAPGIVITPLYKEGQTGSINLKVMNLIDDPSASTSDKYTVNWQWESAPQGFSDVSKEMSYTVNSFSEPFVFTNVPVGIYKVQLVFCDKDSNPLFTTVQWIHVFPDFTTDTWYGYGPQYYEYDSDNDGDVDSLILALSQDCIDYFAGEEEETFPKKLLSYTDHGNGFDISIVSENNYDETTSYFTDFYSCSPATGYNFPNDSTPVSVINRTVSFNANGDIVYNVKIVQDSNDAYNEVVCKYENETVSAYCFPVTNITSSDYGSESSAAAENYVTAIYYDNANKKMYGMLRGKYGANAYFPTFWDYDEAIDEVHHYTGAIMANQKITGFVVKDGYLYVCDYDKGGIRMRCFELTYTPADGVAYPPVPEKYSLAEIYSKQIVDLSSINHTVEVTDMICIENQIYILINDSYNVAGELNSRGAVVKFDPLIRTSGTLKGFVTTDLFDSATVKYLCSKSSTSCGEEDLLLANVSESPAPKYYMDIYFNKNYSPSALDSTNGFFGPRKILSYNEKYLYIADSGRKYNLDGENKISFTPANRVVKFKISDMIIENVLLIDEQYAFVHPNTIILPGMRDDVDVYELGGELYSNENDKYPCIFQ